MSTSAQGSSPVPYEMDVTLCRCMRGLEPALQTLEKLTEDTQVVVARQQVVIRNLQQKLARYQERDRMTAHISSNKSPVTNGTHAMLDGKRNDNVRSTGIESSRVISEYPRRSGMTIAEMAEELRIADNIAMELLGREQESWWCLQLAYSRVYELSADRLKEEAKFKMPNICPEFCRPNTAVDGIQSRASQQDQNPSIGLFDAARKEIEAAQMQEQAKNERGLCRSCVAKENNLQEDDLRHTIDKAWIVQICTVIIVVSILILK